MLSQLFKKGHPIESLIYGYLDSFKLSQENFSKALEACLLDGTFCDQFEFFIKQTHKYESKADDILQEIYDQMYGKALIPESRGDILGLLEAFDSIPELFEHILYMIHTQNLILPAAIVGDIKALIGISLECCDLLVRQVTALFKLNEKLRPLMSAIDANESQCDHIQRKVIRRIFENAEIEPFDKLQLKELIEKIGNISDRADMVSKRINIIRLKRRV
jgi:predicted phosphate transport protein (TIGR00153 family)